MASRALILTHTHAGVHAIRSRLKRLGVPYSRFAIDTIAGWSMRYAHAFPGVATPPDGIPQGAQWDQLYRGASLALQIEAVRQVVAASYDCILIDEYQDCGGLQHQLAITLSSIVPTLIFGDPMQGIFEFAGATLRWADDIHGGFPLVGTLDVPHRWMGGNAELGQWIGETRLKLLKGEPIDLTDPRIVYRESDDPFDMATLFEGMDLKEGNFAAIHCNKTICYRLAKATSGGFQAIEEIAGNRLRAFATAWDYANDGAGRLRSVIALLDDCFHKKPFSDSEVVDPEDASIQQALRDLVPSFGEGNGADSALKFFGLSRRRPRWKLFRGELWRDAERAMGAVAAGRADTVLAAIEQVRQRASSSGRRLPRRTVSTPLLLKGLEFDHVVLPDATHFANERQAQAKLFYVAISRATQSLTISASSQILQFDRPRV